MYTFITTINLGNTVIYDLFSTSILSTPHVWSAKGQHFITSKKRLVRYLSCSL